MIIMIKLKQVVVIKKTMKQVMLIMIKNNKKQIIMIMIKVVVKMKVKKRIIIRAIKMIIRATEL